MQILRVVIAAAFCVVVGLCIDMGLYAQMVSSVLGFIPEGYTATALSIVAGIVFLGLYFVMRQVKAQQLLSCAFSLVVALVMAKVVASFLLFVGMPLRVVISLAWGMAIVGTYCLSLVLLLAQDDFHCVIPFVRLKTDEVERRDIVLDTSVIIDGRIADMCETPFINGRLIIPRFVLRELQGIADSSDSLKRNRGRRGLDVLNKLKGNSRLDVKINDADFPEISTVDAKLVKLAKTMGAQVFTHDFNLAKVAELQSVEVLNINELSNALKPVVLPGEVMEVKVIKQGKEAQQGVAYLEDGTMIVVENGRRLIGKTVRVEVTSAYQTQAGRMIFARKT